MTAVRLIYKGERKKKLSGKEKERATRDEEEKETHDRYPLLSACLSTIFLARAKLKCICVEYFTIS
jgi:hypothetical protein